MDISLYEKTWTLLRKGNLKKEKDSLLIAAQNNAIRTNYIKVKTDYTQKNSKYRLCGDRDKTIRHIIIERRKLIWFGFMTHQTFWVINAKSILYINNSISNNSVEHKYTV